MITGPPDLELASENAKRERRARRSASQRASTLRRLGTVWLVGLSIMVAVGVQTRVPASDLLLDAAVVGGGHWYSGLVTSLGIVIWSVSASAAVGAGYVSMIAGRARAAATMIGAGGLIGVLLLDDLFLLHSNLVPTALGLPKITLLIVEAAAISAWLARYRAEIVRTRWELLGAAGVGFGCSVVVDQVPIADSVNRLLIEDGAKLLGILALAAWSVSTAADLIRSSVRP